MEQETNRTDVTVGADDVVSIGGVPVLRCAADGRCSTANGPLST